MCLFCFAGCAKGASVYGSFSEQLLTLSIGEVFNPVDYFAGGKNVVFVSGDEKIIFKSEGGAFVAAASGKTSLFAETNGVLVDQMQVYVKHTFSAPTNLRVSNDGLLSWDESAILLDGEIVKANYLVKISHAGSEKIEASQTNAYQLAESGEYEVSVKCQSNELVDGSKYSDTLSFKFDMLEGASDFNFTSENIFGSQKGFFTWTGEGDATLEVGGIKSEHTSNLAERDFSGYAEGSEISAALVLKDESLGSSKTVESKISKLKTTIARLENGELVWEEAGATRYLFKAQDALSGKDNIIEVKGQKSPLQGLSEGIYNLTYQAIGGNNLANGNVKYFPGTVGKIANVSAECEKVGNKLRVTFSTTSPYNRRFIVKQNGREREFVFDGEMQNGAWSLTTEFDLEAGENIFSVQALPTLDGGVFEWDGQSASEVLRSDEAVFKTVYVLGEFSKVTHSLKEGQSVLAFDSLEFASDFKVQINGIDVDGAECQIGHAQTLINIGKITKAQYGNVNDFNISILATRPNADGEITYQSRTSKKLTMLNAPSGEKLGGSKLETRTYSWNEMEGAEFEYLLTETDSAFTSEISGEKFKTQQNHTSALKAGYYKIAVRAISLDEDNFLPSEELFEDNFFFAEIISAPGLRLDFDGSVAALAEKSGYVLKIRTSEFGYKYEVFMDEISQGSVFNENGDKNILTFNFDKAINFAEAGREYKIKVRVSAKGADQQAIHMAAEAALAAERLTAPSVKRVGSNETLTVENTDERAELEIFKEGELIAKGQSGKSASVSLKEFDGEFEVKVRAAGYDLFEEYSTDGKTMLSSALTSFKFHRSQTPTELNYKNENISFVHEDRFEKYVCSIEVSSDNGKAQRVFEVDSTLFNLEEAIAKLRGEDEEFNSYFSQKTSIAISIFASVSKEIDGVYYLSSRDARCLYNENSTTLNISKLDEVSLEYDEENNKLVWQPLMADGAIYDVYLGNNRQISITEISESGKMEFALDKYDFTGGAAFDFHVVVRSDNSLRSEPSKKVTLRKITAPKGLSVYRQDEKYFASFKLENSEENYISEIIVNGTSIRKDRVFELMQDKTMLVVKGRKFQENGNKTFYISSAPAEFDIRKIVKGEFEADAKIVDGEIVWSDFLALNANDWSLTTPHQNIAYEIEIFDGSNNLVKTISAISQTKLSLEEKSLLSLVANGYHAALYAYVTSHEVLSGGKSYFGRVLLQENISLRKLEEVKNLTLSLSHEQTGVDGEFAKQILLNWQFEGAASGETIFNILVGGRLVASVSETQFALSQSELSEGENEISVVACSENDISANAVSLKIDVFEKPQISLSDSGVLSITAPATPPATNGFIVELTIDGQKQNIFATSTSLDLQEYIASASGAYSIRVIHRLTSSQFSAVLPNRDIAVLSGDILAQPIINQDATGVSVSSPATGVKFFVRCDEIDFEQEIENNHFDFPDSWESGHYKLVFYVAREGSVQSWTGESAVKDIVIDRVANATEISFTRAENYLDSTISWPDIDSAAGYQFEIYSEDRLVASSGRLEKNSILKSELFARTGALKSGDYTFSFRTLADFENKGQTISKPLDFSVQIMESSVTGISSSAKGEVQFLASSKAAGFHIVAESLADPNLVQHIELASTDRAAVVAGLTGQIKVSVVELATLENEQDSSDKVLLDPEGQHAIFYKLQDIVSIATDAAEGNLIFTTQNDGVSGERDFYAKTTIKGVEYERELAINKTSETTFRVSALKLVENFPIADEGTFNFTVYSVIRGSLRSDEKEYNFEFKFNNGTVTRDKAGELEDYMLIKDTSQSAGQINGLTKIFMRSSVAGTSAWQEHLVDSEQVKGYWLTRTFEQDGMTKVEKYFSKNKIEAEGYVCEEAYGIDITALSADMKEGSREFQIAYITSTEDSDFIVNFYSEKFVYEKMSGPSDVKLDSGNIKWTNSTAANSGFMLYFENEEGEDIIKIQSTDASYYLGEDVKKLGTFTVAVRAVSNVIGRLPSDKIYFTENNLPKEVTKLGPVANEMRVENGALKLEFKDLRQRETEEERRRIDSVEGLIANRNVTTIVETLDIYASALISKVFTHPFNYSMESLKNLRFNLKFINKIDGKIYLTSVEADRLLSRLSDETLNLIFEASENSRILPTLRDQIKKIYQHLTDKRLFGGVATSTFLFDEIGVIEKGVYNKFPARNIPAGMYDIAIQQAGSANSSTLSSEYQTKLENISLSAAPLTMADSAPSESSSGVANKYFVKFQPIEGKTDYMFVLKNKNDLSQVIEYDITFESGKWTRKSFASERDAERVELGLDEEGFVRIALNGEGGLIYETEVKDIYGNAVEIYGQDFSSHIYVRGSESELNGKSESVAITFLKFNISSMAVKGGRFTWDNFNVNGQNYVASVIYKQKNISGEKSTTVPGSQASFAPTDAGEYEYIKFLTQGSFSKFKVVVDSPIYTFENVVKLAAPTVSVKLGRLVVEDSYTNMAFDPRNSKAFVLSNNAGGNKSFDVQKNSEGKFILNRQTGANKNTNDVFGVSERAATVFYAFVNGDSVDERDIAAEGSNLEGFNIAISGLDRNLLLKSESGQVRANKLKLLSGAVKVNEKGDISWTQSSGGADESEIGEGLQILYEIEIEYYFERSSGWEINEQHTKRLISSSTTLKAGEIVDPIPSLETKYKIYIRPNIYRRTSAGDVETIEGETFVLADGAQYTSGAFVLEGELRSTGIDLIERSQSVSDFAIINEGFDEQRTSLRDGTLTWKYKYESEKDTMDVAFEITAIAPNSERILLDGKVAMSEGEDENGFRDFTFEIDPDIQLSPELGYNYEIVAVERMAQDDSASSSERPSLNKIASRVTSLNVKNVRMLPQIKDSDFSTDREGSNVHTIDFSRYFASLSNLQSNVAIEVRYFDKTMEEEKVKFLTSSNKVLKIKISDDTSSEEAGENTIVFNEGENIELELLPKPFKKNDILKSNKATTINLQTIDWSNDDLYFFDDRTQTFYWTFGVKYADKTSAQAQIFVKNEEGEILPLGIKNGETIGGIQNISSNNKIAIWHENTSLPRAIRYVEAQRVHIKDGKAYVETSGLTANIYAHAQDTNAIATISKADGEFELGFKAWALKTRLAIDQGEKEYYIPLNAINKLSQSDYKAAKDCAYYIDENCTSPVSVPKATMLSVQNFNSALSYQEVSYLGGATIYLKTTDILHYLTQDERYFENVDKQKIRFKVSFTTMFVLNEGTMTYATTAERQHDNIPFGRLSYSPFNGIPVDERGIYVTSFEPTMSGTISNFSVQVRKSENNLLSKSLERYAGAKKGEFEFNLFGSGSGDASGKYGMGPYQITNEAQLANITYRSVKKDYHLSYKEKVIIRWRQGNGGGYIRNDMSFKEVVESDKVFYFEQASNLDVTVTDGFYIDQPFVGSYNGNNYAIKVTIASIENLNSPIQSRIATAVGEGSSAVEFTRGAALFKEIGKGGKLSNINVDFDFTLSQSMSSKIGTGEALVGGLVLQNGGEMSSITVRSSAVKFDYRIMAGGKLAISPLIGENKGVANSLASRANVKISNTFTTGAQNFYYGGIIGFNNSVAGKVQGAENQGEMDINFSSNRNGTVMAGGVMLSAFNSSVEMAFNNNASVKAVSKNGTAFAAGCIVHAYNSSVYSSVNTGEIIADNAGGIMFNMLGAQIGTLVGMGKVNGRIDSLLAKSGTVNSAGKCYIYGSYNPPSTITSNYERITSDKTITCKDNVHKIVITYSSLTSYSVEIKV